MRAERVEQQTTERSDGAVDGKTERTKSDLEGEHEQAATTEQMDEHSENAEMEFEQRQRRNGSEQWEEESWGRTSRGLREEGEPLVAQRLRGRPKVKGEKRTSAKVERQMERRAQHGQHCNWRDV